MAKRLSSYRSGDRAEHLGITLLQAICAVAPIPRQEDFGLADALATLLRRSGRFVYAEDSFFVQFKSASEKRLDLLEDSFVAFREQDVSILIGIVSLSKTTVDLYTTGPALAHPNFHEARGLVLYLKRTEDVKTGLSLDDGVLRLDLGQPAASWSVRDIDDMARMTAVYTTLREHLAVDRWNRRHRTTGSARHIQWTTNVPPTIAGETYRSSPTRQMPLADFVPTMRALATTAIQHGDLLEPVGTVLEWLVRNGVERLAETARHLRFHAAQERMRQALTKVPEAHVAVNVEVTGIGRQAVELWLYQLGANGSGSGTRHAGSVAELQEKGFVLRYFRRPGEIRVTADVTLEWIGAHELVELPHEGLKNVRVFRRLTN